MTPPPEAPAVPRSTVRIAPPFVIPAADSAGQASARLAALASAAAASSPSQASAAMAVATPAGEAEQGASATHLTSRAQDGGCLTPTARLAAAPYPLLAPRKRTSLPSRQATPAPPLLTAEERFGLMFEHSAAALPHGTEAAAWRKCVRAFCVGHRQPADMDSIALLERVAASPVALQTRLAQAAVNHFLSRRSKADARVEVWLALAALLNEGGDAAFAAMCTAAVQMQQPPLARELLLAVRTHVPMAHVVVFLRAAECLLESRANEDARIVLAAARACSAPVRPQGLTAIQESRNAGPGGTSQRRPASPPAFTDDDWAVFRRAMEGADFDGQNDRCLRQGDPFDDDACGPGWLPPDLLGGPAPYWYAQHENVQNRTRVKALHVAWAQLNASYPRVLPAEALWQLADGTCKALRRTAKSGHGPFARNVLHRIEKDYPNCVRTAADESRILAGLHPSSPRLAWQVLGYVWDGSGAYGYVGEEHMESDRMPPLDQEGDVGYALDEKGLTSRSLVAQLWWILHADRNYGGATGEDARRERDNMRHAFFSAAMDNVCADITQMSPRNWPPATYQLKLRRLCANGLAQRMLTCLSGYEPISLDRVTPEQLLSQLARQFAQPFGETEEPDAAEVANFYVNAMECAKATFDGEELAAFAANLLAYLHGDFTTVAEEALALVESQRSV